MPGHRGVSLPLALGITPPSSPPLPSSGCSLDPQVHTPVPQHCLRQGVPPKALRRTPSPSSLSSGCSSHGPKVDAPSPRHRLLQGVLPSVCVCVYHISIRLTFIYFYSSLLSG